MQPTQLDSSRIIETTERLCRRVRERFPNAGLNEVGARLQAIAEQAHIRSQEIARPILWVRVVTAAVILGIAGTFAATVYQAGEFVEAGERMTVAELIPGPRSRSERYRADRCVDLLSGDSGDPAEAAEGPQGDSRTPVALAHYRHAPADQGSRAGPRDGAGRPPPRRKQP